ncbi:hypothetical protein QFC22_001789 [Naganishia vaughanmartiniae]|uniref:Uncharacterized protein n=1 Tax=Naganishia vaughanmartiniae TaxID=1424756 RepID=A0ACC2XGI0_9TREE|nr:hypothetical protein QFC22_001789 [Naganishia vaughanmartiniae]
MSNLYMTEPATTGKVIVETTLGEIEASALSSATAKDCPTHQASSIPIDRAMVQRSTQGMPQLSSSDYGSWYPKGYYDGLIFHRVVPGFIAQTGDPSGTGMGGESYYGEPFENETHSRLKFNRRGLVAFANNGDKRSNTSQWFITLDRTDELQNKHTLFGKVVGPTIYNVLKLGELELDKQERPLYPPKITQIRIVENPFDDIVPRITAAERKAQHEARLESQRETERRETRKKAKKNTGLLSFGEEAETQEAAEAAAAKRKKISRPDLVDPEESIPVPLKETRRGQSPAKRAEPTDREKKSTTQVIQRQEEETDDLAGIRERHAAEKEKEAIERKAAIERMQAKLRKLDKRTAGSGSDESDEDDSDEQREKKRKRNAGPSSLDQELAKYANARRGNRKGVKKDEDDVMAALSSFTSKIRKSGEETDEQEQEGQSAVQGEPGAQVVAEEEGLEVDDDVGWMSHALKAVNDHSLDQNRRAETDYTVIDPRAKARALKEDNRRDDKRGSRHPGRR